MMRLRLSTGIATVAMLLPAGARAHTPGLSLADFEVRADGEVDARFTFSTASAEPLAETGLDRNGDGFVTPEDLSAARDDLRAFLAGGVEVAADGSACDGTFQGAGLSETDGLELRATYACPPDPAEVQVTLYYLSTSTRGPSRKGLARIVAASATTEGVLSGERRAISLRLPRVDKGRDRRWGRLIFLPLAALAVALFALSSRRWRAARTTWQNRTP
jgi:hypothetical protein